MLDTLITAYNEQHELDFDMIENITAEELHFCVGLRHEPFQRILEETPSLLERSQRPKTVLGAYLMKIRSGEPNERLAAPLGMSRRSFERKLSTASHCLLDDFVRNKGIKAFRMGSYKPARNNFPKLSNSKLTVWRQWD